MPTKYTAWPYTLNHGSPQACGLAAWWPGDAANSTHDMMDMSRNNLDADRTTPASSSYDPIPNEGRVGWKMLNGTTPFTTAAFPTAVSVTVCARIRMTAVGVLQMMLHRDVSPRIWQFRITAGNLIQFISISAGTPTITGVTALSVDTTYHVAAAYSKSIKKVYLDGLLDNSGAASGADLPSGSSVTRIGAYSTLNTFSGWIWDIRIYDRVLEDGEIWDVCYNGESLKYRPTTVYFGASTAAVTPRRTLLGVGI